jgi:hypothetical protein
MQSTDIAILALIAVVIAAAVLIFVAMRRRRTHALQDRFGEEYDRTLHEHGKRAPAEAALHEREKRVAELDIRPLRPEERGTFVNEWREVKAVFVDSPPEAVLHADRMVAKMMAARGYPMADFDRRYEDLSVDHREVAQHYRAGHDIAMRQGRGQATTEDLRQAMKHYEALFDDLVRDAADKEERGATRRVEHA